MSKLSYKNQIKQQEKDKSIDLLLYVKDNKDFFHKFVYTK